VHISWPVDNRRPTAVDVVESRLTQAMANDERIWLEVPFAEKDAAKAAGARWDWAMRAWYAPRTGMTGLHRWVGRAPLPDLLPGEDRSFGDGLFVDLIPDSCWFTNVRSCVDERDWDRIKRMVRRRARDRCEVCGAQRAELFFLPSWRILTARLCTNRLQRLAALAAGVLVSRSRQLR
jgi:hypothetical protein